MPLLVLLLFIYVSFCLLFVLIHPLLSLSGVIGVLLKAALLRNPLCCNAPGRVVLKRHLIALVLKWVEWLRLPLHQPVLMNQLDPFRGFVTSDRAHAVPPVVAVTLRDTFCLLKNLVRVEGFHALP